MIPFGKLEACLDERKPEAYATTWWHCKMLDFANTRFRL